MNSRDEHMNQGKALRKQTPRKSQATWSPPADRPDPIALLQAQDSDRLQQLLPIKYGRMLESPFAFLRGSAVVMASDLSHTPVSGIDALLCGDAHLSNYGIFATPERNMVFDINDFDEVYPGPWEWDLKRLTTSVVVAGRENNFSEKYCEELARRTTASYRDAMAQFAKMSTLDVWYFYVDAKDVMHFMEKSSKQSAKTAKKVMKKAESHSYQHTVASLTYIENGKRRIKSDPPLLMPYRDMDIEKYADKETLSVFSQDAVKNAWTQYLKSLPEDRQYLLDRYRIVDGALRVGGVGSVGTRCGITLLEGRGEDDALILQLKEADASVLEAYLPKKTAFSEHARRVVVGQRLLQTASDIFLGWHTGMHGKRMYYWRQLKDMKGSFKMAALDEKGFDTYAQLCGATLAHAHARTSDEINIAGYIGSGDAFVDAIADFAVAYADQTERDYQALVDAVKSGRIKAETGV